MSPQEIAGLELSEDEFSGMKMGDKMTVLYRNTTEIRKNLNGIRFTQKVQYLAIAALWAAISFIFYNMAAR